MSNDLPAQKELFAKKDVETKSADKIRKLSDRQLLAIDRKKVIEYFCQKWQAKYGLLYVVPPSSFMSVEKPISDALAKNYTLYMLRCGIDAYLDNNFEGYVDSSHPIKFFTKDIPKWVMRSKRDIQSTQTKEQKDEVQELNRKYGIIRKGNVWQDEKGNVYLTKEQAIEGLTKRK